MVYIPFDEKSSGSGTATLVNKIVFNGDFNQKERPLVGLAMEQLTEELRWPIIRKLEKRKAYFSFKDKISCVDLAGMQVISKLDKGIRFLLYWIDVFSKYTCVVYLKDKKRCSLC